MDQQELSDMLYNRQYTEDERLEEEHLVNTIKNEGFDGVDIGCPLQYAYGRYSTSKGGYYIAAIKKNDGYGFNYYITEAANGKDYHITDFQDKQALQIDDWMREKEFGFGSIPFDSLLWYMMTVRLKNDQRKDDDNAFYYLHRGFFLRAIMDKATGKYQLKPIVHGNGMMMDNIQYMCCYGKPLFERVKCPFCHLAWLFNDANIPIGAKYELYCVKCGSRIRRKKIK